MGKRQKAIKRNQWTAVRRERPSGGKNRECQTICQKKNQGFQDIQMTNFLWSLHMSHFHSHPAQQNLKYLSFNYTDLRTEIETVRELTKVSPLVISRNRTKSACIKQYCVLVFQCALRIHAYHFGDHCSSNVLCKLICKK